MQEYIITLSVRVLAKENEEAIAMAEVLKHQMASQIGGFNVDVEDVVLRDTYESVAEPITDYRINVDICTDTDEVAEAYDIVREREAKDALNAKYNEELCDKVASELADGILKRIEDDWYMYCVAYENEEWLAEYDEQGVFVELRIEEQYEFDDSLECVSKVQQMVVDKVSKQIKAA